MKAYLCFSISLLLSSAIASAQNGPAADTTGKFPSRMLSNIDGKTSGLDDALTTQTEKYLRKLQRKDQKIQQQLMKVDSSSSQKLNVNNVQQYYASLMQKIRSDSALLNPSMGPQYLPYVDSLKVGLAFLNTNPQFLNNSKILPTNIQNSLNQINLLETKMQDADQIKQFLQSRKEQLQNILSQYSHLPPSITNLYSSYSQELYYYSQTVREYRDELNDPDKMEKTALQLLNKIPAFSSFMQKNSFLAGIFGLPGDYGTPAAMEGLQSRDQVLALIKNQMGGGGPSAASMLQQNLQTAQQDISKLRDKVNALGAGNGNMDMPDFKPQNQRTKSFMNRLEYGTSLQTQHASDYYPTSTNIFLSVSYKLDDKKSVGIQAGYVIGWGSDINHIQVSSQGYSVGSFIDMQLKKGIFITGGYGITYQKPINIPQDQNTVSNFQRSGVIGLGKMVKIKSSFFKKTKIEILWNFLSYYQVPQTTPFLFQVGYNF
jgi:hypothetical protein